MTELLKKMSSFRQNEIILFNGWILTEPGTSEVVPHHMTVISGDRLFKVNVPKVDVSENYETIDCTGCLIMPGLVNGHNHAAMSLLRGLADDLPLDRWLRDFIFPAETKYASPNFVLLGTMLSTVEMAMSGTTTLADGYFHMESAAEAVKKVGLRAVVAQGILDVPTPDAPAVGTWKERAKCFLVSCIRDPLITPALFCHSPYLCGPDTFVQAADLAKRNGVLLFAHVAETEWEVSEMKARYGRRPIEHLDSVGILGRNFVAIHAVHPSEQELEILTRTGTSVVHCPESNMKLASGAAPVTELRSRGICVGLGTDGPASNNNLDMFEEMRSASLMAKLADKNPQALDARSVLRMATLDGARALGMDDRIGSLVPGKLADLIVIDMDRPHLTPCYDLVSHLVYAARGSDVREVIVNGECVVHGGSVVTVDEIALMEQVRELSAKIAQDLGIPTHVSPRSSEPRRTEKPN